MKGGILSDRKVRIYDDLREPLKLLVLNKGTYADAAKAIGLSDGRVVGNFLNGGPVSLKTMCALIEYCGYMPVLHRKPGTGSGARVPGSGGELPEDEVLR